MSFDSLGLRPELLRAVREQDYTIPTAVQIQAIPAVLAGREDIPDLVWRPNRALDARGFPW